MVAVYAKILSLQLSNSSGKNVHLLVTDDQSTFNLMESGDFISQTTASTLVNKFISSSAEELCIVFYQPSANVDIEEKQVIGAGNTEMICFQLTSLGVKALCDLALKTYKCLLDNGLWPAALSIPKMQPGALSAAFQDFVSDPAASAAYQVMSAELNLLQMQANIPTIGSGVVPPGAECMTNVTCYNCGQKGHTRVQCPNKPSWKFIAPVNGALITITRKDKI